MERSVRAGPYMLVPIADTDGRFGDFGPYVASINDAGVVAFQATLRQGGSGVYVGSGGPVSAIAESGAGRFSDVVSHPDIDHAGSVCFYATLASGGRPIVLVRDRQIVTIADESGPLGPTMSESGRIAFRATDASGGARISTWDGELGTTIARSGDIFRGFQGLPVIHARGAVAFRADLRSGGEGIYVMEGGARSTVTETGDVFSSLGRFPSMNEVGSVAFCASLRDGRSGVFVANGDHLTRIIDTTGPFESFRGVLLGEAGTLVFYGTPRGGTLGVFSGLDPIADRVIGLGESLFDSTIVDFALNPVSMNASGQIAIRVKLEDGRQWILRADPARTVARIAVSE